MGVRVYCSKCHMLIALAERRREIDFVKNGIKFKFIYHNRHTGDCWNQERAAVLEKRENAIARSKEKIQ